MNNYAENVAIFEKIDSAKAQDLVKGEAEAVIYIGKSVCPFCIIFVEKLNKVAKDTDTTIYYVSSVEKTDMEGITALRKEYNIPTVPGFIYTNGDTVNLQCDSSMSEEEIQPFMNN